MQDDAEIRLSFDTTTEFAQVVSVLSAAHNYDVPMIVGEALDGAGVTDAEHVKGTLSGGAHASSLASSLAASRLVACAQVSEESGTVHVKTVRAAIAPIDERVRLEAASGGFAPPSIAWTQIAGNADYLSWVSEETRVEGCDEA